MYTCGTCSCIFTSSQSVSTLGVSGINYLSSVLWKQPSESFTKELPKGCPAQGTTKLQSLRDSSRSYKRIVGLFFTESVICCLTEIGSDLSLMRLPRGAISRPKAEFLRIIPKSWNWARATSPLAPQSKNTMACQIGSAMVPMLTVKQVTSPHLLSSALPFCLQQCSLACQY